MALDGRYGFMKLVLLSSLLVGTLDILSAFVDVYVSTGRNPLIVLNYIASAVYGPAARSGGVGMQLLGLLFHFIIAYTFTLNFFLVYKPLKLDRFSPLIVAVLYGIFIWVVMNRLVVPNTLIGKPAVPPPAWKMAKAAIILIVMIGLPLALIGKRFFRSDNA